MSRIFESQRMIWTILLGVFLLTVQVDLAYGQAPAQESSQEEEGWFRPWSWVKDGAGWVYERTFKPGTYTSDESFVKGQSLGSIKSEVMEKVVQSVINAGHDMAQNILKVMSGTLYLLMVIVFIYRIMMTVLKEGDLTDVMTEIIEMVMLFGLAIWLMSPSWYKTLVDSFFVDVPKAIIKIASKNDVDNAIDEYITSFSAATATAWSALGDLGGIRKLISNLLTAVILIGLIVCMEVSILIFIIMYLFAAFAMAIGIAVGPVMIPWMIWKHSDFIFKGWLRYMLQSMMQMLVANMTAVLVTTAVFNVWPEVTQMYRASLPTESNNTYAMEIQKNMVLASTDPMVSDHDVLLVARESTGDGTVFNNKIDLTIGTAITMVAIAAYGAFAMKKSPMIANGLIAGGPSFGEGINVIKKIQQSMKDPKGPSGGGGGGGGGSRSGGGGRPSGGSGTSGRPSGGGSGSPSGQRGGGQTGGGSGSQSGQGGGIGSIGRGSRGRGGSGQGSGSGGHP